MGTFRTNRIHVTNVLEIIDFELTESPKERTKGLTIKCKKTKLTQFHSPLHTNFIWELGENHTEVSSGEEIEVKNFLDKQLYKIVCRGGKNYIMILNLVQDSKVYSGSSTGKGLYFETDLKEAMKYLNNNNQVEHAWDDDNNTTTFNWGDLEKSDTRSGPESVSGERTDSNNSKLPGCRVTK